MRYYIILLKDGEVVDVCSYDNSEAFDAHYARFQYAVTHEIDCYFDDVQKFLEVT